MNPNQSPALLSGGASLLVGFMVVNFLAYLFQLLMGRFLATDEYGVLISLMALLTLLLVPMTALQMTIAKFVAEWKGKGEGGKTADFFSRVCHWIGLVTIGLVLVAFLTIKAWGSFLHISNLFILSSFALLVGSSFLSLVPIGFLQGLLRFREFTIANLISPMTRIIFGLTFVVIGLKLEGAIGALLIGAVLTIVFGFGFLSKDFKPSPVVQKGAFESRMIRFLIGSFLITLTLTSFINTDLVLVKHFFSGPEAGIYSAGSVLGRMIYFGLYPLSLFLLPVVAERKGRGESSLKIVGQVFAIALFLALMGILIFSLASTLLVRIFFLGSTQYVAVSPLLGRFAMVFSLVAMISLSLNLFLALNKPLLAIWGILGVILQIAGIILWHQSLDQVLWVSVSSCLFVFLALAFFSLSVIIKSDE